MKFTNNIRAVLTFTAITFLIFSCSKEEGNISSNTPNDSQELFFSFQTPDWARTIPCDKIDFLPTYEISEGVAYVLATSASTNAAFGFPFPTDSSAINMTSNIRKYRISDYNSWGTSEGASFEISLKLNKTGVDDTNKLYSVAGESNDNFNEITSIEYIGSDSNYANFKVKGQYKMKMVDPVITTDIKQVTGSYCIKFHTHKK